MKSPEISKATAIIAAAGGGKRAGFYKQFLKLGSKTVLTHIIDLFDSLDFIETIIVALPPGRRFTHRSRKVAFVPGGRTRQKSVCNALERAASPIVIIHDCARPFVSTSVINRVYRGSLEHGACIAAIRPKDTIKLASNSMVERTVNRDQAFLAQTPQGFRLDIIRRAHSKARRDGFTGTDDCQLVERLGIKVAIVESEDLNFKLTTPLDIKIAKYLTKIHKIL
jgi:2-C-methyl-D-erythritol 4-phosphate cytidylyltransferase